MKVKVKLLSRVQLFLTLWTVAYQAPPFMGFSRQEYWSGLPFLLQGLFPTQGLNLGLPHCRQMPYPLSHQGSNIFVVIGFKNVSHAFVLCSKDWASLIAQLEKNPPPMQETSDQFLGQEDLLEKGKAIHSSILGLLLWLS